MKESSEPKRKPESPPSLDEANRAALVAEENFRLLVESIHDYAIFMLDADGRIRNWNRGAERIKGYAASEVIGRPFSIFYTPEDIARDHPRQELAIAVAQGRYEEEGWRVKKDGSRFWANVVITALRKPDGTHVGFAKVTRDLTERKAAEERLREANIELEKRVAARTAELEEAIRARDEFLSIASHELRTPLTPLKLQLQMLIRQLRENFFGSDARFEKMVHTTERAVSRLASLIDNLLDVSRINAGRLTLNYEESDLAEIAHELISRYAPEIAASGSPFSFEADPEVVGDFDRLRVEQVFVNLLTNALKYGDRRPVAVSVRRDGERAKLVFRDQGIGIEDAEKSKIFERFERLDTTQGISGMGLGLYITRQIVEAHGGSIEVISERGRGSAFTVSLPLTRSASPD